MIQIKIATVWQKYQVYYWDLETTLLVCNSELPSEES